VRRQPILAHVDAFSQPARHHPPTEGALKAAKGKDAEKLRAERPTNATPRRENDQWNQERDA